MKTRALLFAGAALATLIAIAPDAHAQVTGPALGGSGGNPFPGNLTCPNPSTNHWLTGFRSRFGIYVDSLRGFCGSDVTAWAGGAGGDNDQNRLCAAGEAVTGVLAAWGGWMDAFTVICTPLSSVAANLRTGEHTLGIVGGSGGNNSNFWLCPVGMAATAFHGASGSYMDRVGIVCEDVP